MIKNQQVDRCYADRLNGAEHFTRATAKVLATDPIIALGDLVDELKALRKGRGLFVTDISKRVGPALREISGVTDQDGPAEIRRKVTRQLEKLACALPSDLRVAAMAAFAIIHEAQFPLYQERVEWTAGKINRDSRTARRRIDDAISQLAQLATAQPPLCGPVAPVPHTRWHTSDLRLVVALDGDRPEAIEYRRIVADCDGLTELNVPAGGPLVTTARAEDGSAPSILHGGIRLDAGTGWAHAMRLPRTLRLGETHEYALRYRTLSGEATQSQITHVSDTRCDHFELHVRFGLKRLPRRIWVSDARLPRTADVDSATREMPTDAAGEAHLTFDDLIPGRAYGLRWVW